MSTAEQPYNIDTMAERPTNREAPLFGQRMAALHQQKGLTQVLLAERMNTTQKMIDYCEGRSANPTFDVMQKIVAALESV